MRRETRETLLAGADKVVASVGPFQTCEAMFAWLSETSDRVHRASERVKTRAQVAEMLDAEAEPSPLFLAVFQGTVRFAPYLIGRLVKWVAEGSAKSLESNPRGPKLGVPAEEREHICAFIGALFARGVSLKVAHNRAAKQMVYKSENH